MMMRHLTKKHAALAWVKHYRELKLRQAEQDARHRAVMLAETEKARDDARDLTDSTRVLCISQTAPGQAFDPFLMQLWYAELNRCEAAEKSAQTELEEAESIMDQAKQHWQGAQMATDRATEDLAQTSRKHARAKDQARLTDAEELFANRAARS
jgi:hypothetical protein